MSAKIPPEVDRLMWAVAENPVPDAMDEFGQRYPNHRAELLKRVEMVRSLRNEVKASGHIKHQIPKFEPKTIPHIGTPRGIYVAFALGVMAIAFAAFTAITSLRATAPPPVLVQTVETGPLVLPRVLVKPPTFVSQRLAPEPPSNRPVPLSDIPVQSAPLADRRRDLNLKDVQLIDALSLITNGTNLKLEIGPGFVNQKVTLAFRERTTKEMLLEMAKEYAFTVSDEGNGQFLVLPVPDTDGQDPVESKPQRRVGP